jgi:hypothetical protein
MIGRMLGHNQITREIGKGGMGKTGAIAAEFAIASIAQNQRRLDPYIMGIIQKTKIDQRHPQEVLP